MTSKIENDSRKMVFVSFATVVIISLLAAVSFCWLNVNSQTAGGPSPAPPELRVWSTGESDDDIQIGEC